MYKTLIKAFILRNISLFFIITISVSLSMLGYFVANNLVSNAQSLIAGEIKPILGGDIIVDTGSNSRPDIVEYLDDLKRDGIIEYARDIQIFTNIQDAEGNFELASLSFVDDNYPLYGERILEEINPSGVAILNESAYSLIENDIISLFDNEYNVGGVIRSSGTELNVFSNGRPQVYLPYEEIRNSGISEQNSLLENNMYIKLLDEDDFDTVLDGIQKNNIFDSVRVQNYQRGGDRFASVLDTLAQFINYILITSFLFSLLIIFLSIESFFIGEKRTFSILKILGLSIYNLVFLCMGIFLLILLLSSGVSYFLTELIFIGIRSFDLSSSFVVSKSSIPTGIFLGVLILMASVLAPLIKFVFHSPLDGLKQNFLQIYKKTEIFIQLLLAFIGVCMIAYILGNSIFTSCIISGILLISIGTLVGLIFLLLRLYYRIFGTRMKQRDFIRYDAIRNTVKPGNLSGIIVLSFIIIYSAFIFISLLFLNFYDRLNLDLENDKNVFIINLNEESYDLLDDSIKTDTYQILKARISTINDMALEDHLDAHNITSGRGRYTREFNITDNALVHVKVIDGVSVISSGEVSIDADFSKSSRISIGDKIEFLVFGLKKTLIVTNIRESQEGSVNPFFYFQVYPDDFERFPKTYFVAASVAPENIQAFKNETISKIGSSASFIEVDQILKQVKSISIKILALIQTLYGYIMIFSLLSVIICIRFFKMFQKRKQSLYYILGADKMLLSKNSAFEYNFLQTLGVGISLIISSIGSYLILAQSEFISFTFINYIYSLIGVAIVFICISLFIVWIMRR